MAKSSKAKNAQKRRREREKSETANTENRTDSGFSSTEERESYNELDAPRDLTAGESQSLIVQSAAQQDSQSTLPTKKRNSIRTNCFHFHGQLFDL